jgi:hypothetical protein
MPFARVVDVLTGPPSARGNRQERWAYGQGGQARAQNRQPEHEKLSSSTCLKPYFRLDHGFVKMSSAAVA